VLHFRRPINEKETGIKGRTLVEGTGSMNQIESTTKDIYQEKKEKRKKYTQDECSMYEGKRGMFVCCVLGKSAVTVIKAYAC
jgi:hypothetical protein